MNSLLVHTAWELRKLLAELRRPSVALGLVPTMGALNAGHGRLIEQARGDCGLVVVSIFVNPIQFNRQDDYEQYPRTLDADLSFCKARGVDIVFAPSIEEMYPGRQRTFVDVERVSEKLCGKFRPGHFRGVATAVTKLLNIVQPDLAYFGEKDAQQLAVIRRMVRDLNMPVEIVAAPTVREPDGLAMSSRNQHLNAVERRAAPALYQGLLVAGDLIRNGATDPEEVRRAALAVIAEQPLLRVEYLEIVDPEEMQPVKTITGPVRVAVAAWLGSTRLIDNVLCEPDTA